MYCSYSANFNLELLGDKIYKIKTIEQIEDQSFCKLIIAKLNSPKFRESVKVLWPIKYLLSKEYSISRRYLFIFYIPFPKNTAFMTSLWKRCVLIKYQIFLTYFFCFSFYNLYYLEKNFVSSYNSKIRIVNQYFLLWSNFLALFIILDTWSMFKFSQQMLNLLVIYCFLFQGQQWLTKNT